jgi:hypothetical protein
MTISRRALLQAAGIGGLSLATGAWSRRPALAAATSVKPKLITVFLDGGWDTGYAIDPKTDNANCDAAPGQIKTIGGLDVMTDSRRADIEAFFAKYAQATAIVRGISVSSVAHPECKKRILTGTRDSSNPDFNAIVAHQHGGGLPLPYLVIGNTAFAGEYAAEAGRLGQTSQLVTLVDPRQAIRPTGTTGAMFALSEQERTASNRYLKARADRLRNVRGAAGYNKKRLDDFSSSIDRSDLLRQLGPSLGTRGGANTLRALIPLTINALQQGLSHTVMLDASQSWDTHTDNSDQGVFQNELFANLTLLLDSLSAQPGVAAGHTMLDETVIVVISEMSRTPKLNAALGKDHWPVTSAMVIGSGVKGGKAYGQTTAAVEAMNVDFASGQATASGHLLESKNFAAGLLTLCGVDSSASLPNVEPFHAFIA